MAFCRKKFDRMILYKCTRTVKIIESGYRRYNYGKDVDRFRRNEGVFCTGV